MEKNSLCKISYTNTTTNTPATTKVKKGRLFRKILTGIAAICLTVTGMSGAQAEFESFSFDGKMSDTVIITETSYSSPHIHVEMTYCSGEDSPIGSAYSLADVYVADVRCIQNWFAGFSYERGGACASPIEVLAEESNSILAINGDYYSSNNESFVVRDGVLYREPLLDYDALALYEDGTMKVYEGSDLMTQQQIDEAAENAWQIWSFGPSLLDSEGKARTDLGSSVIGISGNHPRSAIGYYEPGHYCFLTVEGRVNGARGATLNELAQLFESFGCRLAYNLDGGASSAMLFEGKNFLTPMPDQRVIPDIIRVVEFEDDPGATED